MMKLTILALLPLSLFGSIDKTIESRLHDIRDRYTELSLTCSQDVYIYYMLIGMEVAYVECLELLHKDECICK